MHDTGSSLTAPGIGTVLYDSIETLPPFVDAPIRVLDNLDRGFTLTGDVRFPDPAQNNVWQRNSAGGFGGDQYVIAGPERTDTARWVIDGLTPGLYRISTTWSVNSFGNLPDAPTSYTILDGDRIVASELIKQRVAPADFGDLGVTWSDIASPVLITSHRLEVLLETIVQQPTLADAVRVERISVETSTLASSVDDTATTLPVANAAAFPNDVDIIVDGERMTVTAVNIPDNQLVVSRAEPVAHATGGFVFVLRPEVEVRSADVLIRDASHLLDFGTTQPGTPLSRTLTIGNTGAGPLTIDFDPGSLPNEFTATLPAGTTTVQAGQTLPFTVKFEGDESGSVSGQFRFLTSDLDEGEFTIDLFATVLNADQTAPASLPLAVTVGGVDVADNFGFVEFLTPEGRRPLTYETIRRTFDVQNTGPSDLALVGPLFIPAGFSLVSTSAFGTDTGTLTLASNESTSFTLQFDAGAPGAVTGRIAIRIDGLAEPFDFSVAGFAEARATDNSDNGFELVLGGISQWQLVDRLGRNQDYLRKRGGDGTDIARWTFDVVPGEYQVSATWPGFGSAGSSNVPFHIYDGGGSGTGTLLGTFTADQRTRPTDFLDDNTFWANLGGRLTVTTDTLVVELSDDVNNPLVNALSADAVRIERVTGSEVAVFAGDDELTAGTGTIDFGTTPLGTAVTQTVTVRNIGVRPMRVNDSSLAASLARLPGFSLAASFGTTLIEPGGSTTFEVQFDATVPGTHAGDLSFQADDIDESLFTIRVLGSVTGVGQRPDMSVTFGGNDLINGSAVVAFGTTEPGFPVQRTIDVTNVGTSDLVLR